tara:strand:+ start:628 stop:894 length:267 start_codon:yes stop_codon:yes gene_type:complete
MTITIQGNGATLIDAKNPVWANEEKTLIELDCKFSHYPSLGITENDGYLSYMANPDDPEEHGRQIFEKAKAGEYGTVGDYVAPSSDPE